MVLETLFPGVAMITGAAGTGIGAATAKTFAREGCLRLAITDLNAARLEETKQAILAGYPGTEILSIAGDISDEEFVERFISESIERFGRLDYAVNCAGVLGSGTKSVETSTEAFDKINSVNYRGSWLCSRAQIRAMINQEPLENHVDGRKGERGSIVNIASQLGIVGRPAAPAYCASKAAVIALTRSDAIDYSSQKIRVNCICPGVIQTPMTTGNSEIEERLRPAIEIAPMKRMGLPEEVADCALFLCSIKASFVQGHAMVVDGGYVIN